MEHSKIEETEFTKEQNDVWRTLYQRQLPRVKEHACQEYLVGFERLDLPPDTIPSIEFLNNKITPASGWKTVRTSVRYTDAVPWYKEFAQRHFLVTDYMRERSEMDFTPEPDMFHDIFGHLPFMMLPEYAALEDMFAPAFLRANDEQRENIKRLAWFSTEFGLIQENGERKIFGAGLISSASELDRVIAGETPILPFKIENVIENEKAIWNFNEVLFEFESIDACKAELATYFDQIK
jgi:phenylalanine-4-hydroxylase